MSNPILSAVKVGLAIGVISGFAAGKIDLDDKIKGFLHNQNVKIGKLNAKLLVDELVQRGEALGSGES